MEKPRGSARRRIVLSLPLLLLACGQPPTDQPLMGQPDVGQPATSAPGDASRPVQGQSLSAGTNTLQYEPLLFSNNGWGPAEKNRSNGEQAAGDGKPLTLNGKVYAQGYGTHASSDLRFSLSSSSVSCTRFTSEIGLDDEVGTRGSVNFQVFLDGIRAYDSGTMTGESPTRLVDLDLTGKRELRLVVTDGGNGPTNDHADWADLKVFCSGTPTPTAALRHLEYVAVDRAIKVYDIDAGYRLVRSIPMPNMYGLRGIAANAVSDRLYIPYWGDRSDPKYAGQATFGYLVALDLKTDQVLWTRKYSPSIDSLAITPDGKKLYMPSGEDFGSDFWFVLDAGGNELTRIPVFKNAHNTVIGASGRRVYMASISSNYLTVADTVTDRVISKIGPFFTSTANSGIRPFTVNNAETLAFVNLDHFSGFEIGDLATGKVLYSVPVQGFPWVDPAWPLTQSHGIALTPDEKEAWVLDSHNRSVHIFDLSGLPGQAPRQIADLDVRDPNNASNLPKWVNFTRDGRFAQLSTGAVIDTATRRRVTTLDNTRYFLQVDVQGGEPMAAYSRYGLGYR
jgi:DNA-binding beta-propeller fold protein YncE